MKSAGKDLFYQVNILRWVVVQTHSLGPVENKWNQKSVQSFVLPEISLIIIMTVVKRHSSSMRHKSSPCRITLCWVLHILSLPSFVFDSREQWHGNRTNSTSGLTSLHKICTAGTIVYCQISEKVRIYGKLSPNFDVSSGVCQRCFTFIYLSNFGVWHALRNALESLSHAPISAINPICYSFNFRLCCWLTPIGDHSQSSSTLTA